MFRKGSIFCNTWISARAISPGCVQSSLYLGIFWGQSTPFLIPYEVQWCQTVRSGSSHVLLAVSRLHIQEVPYRSALVHSKPQAPGCGCLHGLLHPSLEPKAFHHEAIECFLSFTGRRYPLQTSCLPSRSLLSRSTESLWNHLHLQGTDVGGLFCCSFFFLLVSPLVLFFLSAFRCILLLTLSQAFLSTKCNSIGF